MKKRAILFDLDDTLYDLCWPFERACQDILPDLVINIEEIYKKTRHYSDEVFEISQSGEMPLEDMYCYRYQNAFRDFGIKLSREEAIRLQERYEFYQERIELSPVVENLLKELGKSWTIGIISNGLVNHQLSKIRTLKLDNIIAPENTFVSEETGYSKPSREFFDYALSKMNLRPEECYYVGDTFETDINGARNAGLTPIWYNHRKYDKQIDADFLKIITSEEEMKDYLLAL